MDDHVRAVLQRAEQVGRRKRVVDDDRELVLFCDFPDRVEVDDVDAGVAERFVIDGLGLRGNRLFKVAHVVRVDKNRFDAVLGKRVRKQIVGAAVQRAGRDDLVPFARDVQNGVCDGGGAGRDAQPRGTAFQRRDALFKDVRGRIGQAGVNVARNREAEAPFRLGGVFKHVGGGLVNRDGAGARCGVRFLTGLYLEGIESKFSVAHFQSAFQKVLNGFYGFLSAWKMV